ncbi:MAG: hypothetical protein M1828_001602 [Chrysothrix sp. TS-e1954]|nr:MAG: hypothetical protein M1828_001602 [Chrysothrix sp. TS-e1954]
MAATSTSDHTNKKPKTVEASANDAVKTVNPTPSSGHKTGICVPLNPPHVHSNPMTLDPRLFEDISGAKHTACYGCRRARSLEQDLDALQRENIVKADKQRRGERPYRDAQVDLRDSKSFWKKRGVNIPEPWHGGTIQAMADLRQSFMQVARMQNDDKITNAIANENEPTENEDENENGDEAEVGEAS